MKKRALWLLNHTTLREFEVPLLVEMGFEVFTPKIFQVGAGDGSATITYEYDKTLTIPPEVLKRLNEVDFYAKLDRETLKLVNEYFDIAFFHYFKDQFRWLVDSFEGVLVFQAFGLLFSVSYTELILIDHGIPFFQRLRTLGQRFFFAQAYPNLKDVECDYFQQRCVDMPLGLKGTDDPKRWVGGDPRFLFVLPRINTANYFKEVYQDFKKNFSDIDHMIAGAQPIPVTTDPKVTGFMSREDYDYAMTHCCAMFYHSTEKNHIHYHPFEAVKVGMPLVFMGGGMMDTLGGKGLPGRCETVREAHRKLAALSRGDRALAGRIVASQDVLLKHFSHDNCREKLEKALDRINTQMGRRPAAVKRKKKVAVILPQPYLGGILDYTVRIIKCLIMGAKERGDELSVVLGYPDDPIFQERDRFRQLEGLDVSRRSFKWEKKKKEWLERTYKFMNVPAKAVYECCVPDDGCDCFQDCDYLIFTADRIPEPLYTSRPYIVVAHDYIQRYVPEMFKEKYEFPFIESTRAAEAVFVTTPSTRMDAIQYAGISEDKIVLTPLMFDLVPRPTGKVDMTERRAGDYFLWTTNTASHKNHLKALLGLAEYYRQGGRLNCVISGVNTELFDLRRSDSDLGSALTEYVLKVRKLIAEDALLMEHIFVKGNMPKEQYLQVLEKAKFVFHPGYADNGNGTAVDGACLGVPTVCSDYPAMRYMDGRMGLHMRFFDPFDEKSIENALTEAERRYPDYAREVPPRRELERFTVEGSYRELYAAVREVMG